MGFLFNSIKSDFEKIKRQSILILHVVLPILAVIVFTVYYSYTHFNPASKASGFLEMATLLLPALIGVVSAMAVDQESSAGSFQHMLTSHIKIVPFLSKIIVTLLLGLSAMLILTCGFSTTFKYILHQNPFGFSYYLYAAFILFLSSIFVYVLHFIVSFKFGGNASIGLGIFETLLAALFNTDLGSGKWMFMPCTWGMRFIMNFHKFMLKTKNFSNGLSELHLGILLCALGSIAITIFACLWFLNWEGRKSE